MEVEDLIDSGLVTNALRSVWKNEIVDNGYGGLYRLLRRKKFSEHSSYSIMIWFGWNGEIPDEFI